MEGVNGRSHGTMATPTGVKAIPMSSNLQATPTGVMALETMVTPTGVMVLETMATPNKAMAGPMKQWPPQQESWS